MFDKFLKHTESYVIKLLICFPRLINSLLLAQKPNILFNEDVVGSLLKLLSFSFKLFRGNHAPDVVHHKDPTEIEIDTPDNMDLAKVKFGVFPPVLYTCLWQSFHVIMFSSKTIQNPSLIERSMWILGSWLCSPFYSIC